LIEKDNIHEKKKNLSVVLAIRNEESHIERCLNSLINQQLPHEQYEIIVIDGMSNDRTREVLELYQKNFPNIIRILNNPGKNQAIGRNIGIRNTEADVILIFSGHATASPLFLDTLLNLLTESSPEVAAIGGIHIPPDDETNWGKVMADVQGSFLGGGGTSYRQQTSRQYVDTVAFCVYKKNILMDVGLYDERFDIGEDVELNWRIKKAGYKLMVTREAIAYYYRKHSSFKLLSRRMASYGIWRALVTKKHPGSFKIIFCLPVIILVSLVSLPFFVAFNNAFSWVILIGLALYFLSIIGSSILLSIKRKSIRYFFIASLIYPIEHLSIAVGFIAGLAKKLPEQQGK